MPEAVQCMADNGIASGLKDDLFGPERLVTRAQFVTFLWRYAGQPPTSDTETEHEQSAADDLAFDDVPDDSDYIRSIQWAVSNNVVRGTADSKFQPSKAVTRAQVVVMLHRLSNLSNSSETVEESASEQDSSRPWYQDAIDWAVEHDSHLGAGDSWGLHRQFNSEQPVTRAQVATLIHSHHLVLAAPAADNIDEDNIDDGSEAEASEDVAASDGGDSVEGINDNVEDINDTDSDDSVDDSDDSVDDVVAP